MRFKTIAGMLPVLLFVLLTTSCVREANTLVNPAPDLFQYTGRGMESERSDTVIVGLAKINNLPGGSTAYLFNELQSPYIVSATHPDAAVIRRLADDALENKRPLRLVSSAPGNLSKLETPTDTELRQWTELRRYDFTDAEPARPFDFRGDTLTFNSANFQKWRPFKLCSKIIPDLATAKTIFNFCRQQTCTFGPTQVQPCIPFKYAKDGCFARAHKMRYIIERMYGYCSEKVFSYGNNATLYVKASLSGGCCVNWWYHVAPVVRVKVNGLVLLYVIDPSMFKGPVPLLDWLMAQENTSCNSGADLSDYSIQPSSAYHPNGYIPVTSYATDPNYTATNSDLLYYGSLGETCDNP